MVKFFSAIPRPVRLCEATRRFAYDSLHAVYGREAEQTPYVEADEDGRTDADLYDAAIRTIAERAPIRILEDERISGAATLGGAINGFVPVTVNGKPPFRGIDHVTFGFDRVLQEGIDGMEREVDEALITKGQRARLLRSLKNVAQSLRIWHGRYLQALEAQRHPNAQYLKNVPFAPPQNFREAVQSLWFAFAFTRLTGNWSGIGRIDRMLGRYLEDDLAQGIITIDEAREVLAHFFIKGCEWITGKSNGTGDAQHYQNIVLGGCDEDGMDVTNAVSFLVLDILEELPIGDFPVTVRAGGNPALLRRAAEVMRYGGGVVAIYGEQTVLAAMQKDGYDLRTARRFANDGCWEVQIPGETYFRYIPFDGYKIFQDALATCRDDDYEDLYGRFMAGIERTVGGIHAWATATCGERDGQWTMGNNTPCAVASFFTRGCAEKGLSYTDGGAVYNVVSPHLGGLPDTANALYAVKKAVFEEKWLSLDTLKNQIAADWPDERLRLRILRGCTWYGNGDAAGADGIAARILHDFSTVCRRLNALSPLRFPAGVSTFGRQIEWAPDRAASAFGLRKGSILSGNFSATPGTDEAGVTALVRSYCTADLTEAGTGAALDVRLTPSCVREEAGVDAVVSLLNGFVALGGFFLQADVIDAETLRRAQEDPESYRTLSVRVSGWNARFVTLNESWQCMIIERAERCTE